MEEAAYIEWCMMNSTKNRKTGRMLRGWAGLFLLGITVLLLTGMGYDDSDTELTVYLRKEEAWEICLSEGPVGVADGRNMALLLKLELPRGWTVSSVDIGEGAEGMSLTAGDREGGICLLLDGLPCGEGEVLVRMRLSEDGEGRPRIIGEGQVILYCLEEDGGITKIPIGIRAETEPPAPPTEDMFTEEVTQEKPIQTEAQEPESDPIADQKTPPPLPWGCQETVPQNGLFAVRFWFRDGAPVVCLEGGGVVTVTVEECGDGGWISVTFRDLDIRRRYAFAVFTPDGVVMAVYEGGIFRGFDESL